MMTHDGIAHVLRALAVLAAGLGLAGCSAISDIHRRTDVAMAPYVMKAQRLITPAQLDQCRSEIAKITRNATLDAPLQADLGDTSAYTGLIPAERPGPKLIYFTAYYHGTDMFGVPYRKEAGCQFKLDGDRLTFESANFNV